MGRSGMLFAGPPGPMNLRVCAQRGESLEAGGFVASAKQVLDLVPVNQRMCLVAESLLVVSVTQLCPTHCNPWAIICQAPLSLGFSRTEYWSGLPLPPPGNPLDPGIKPGSPALAGRFFTTEPSRKPLEGSLSHLLK